MYYYEVAPNRIVRSDQSTFTYAHPTVLTPGTIVRVPVGRMILVGIVVKKVAKPAYATKAIEGIVDTTPIPQPLLDAAYWLSEYYVTPLATVLQTILPRGVDKKRRSPKPHSIGPKRNRTKIVFNSEQSQAIDSIVHSSGKTVLLQGITGSGKTEIYKELAKQSLRNGKSVIILTPEIALTPQLIGEFSNDFKDIILTHSGMTESSRHQSWVDALHSTKPRLVIGPRSALFMPLAEIGLIVVDEAHEPSYKQEQSPRYSALRLASMLGRYHSATVVFGTATPLISDRYLAEASDNPIVHLRTLARPNSQPPDVALVDMKQRNQFKKHRFLSDSLLSSIDESITLSKQTLLFHNRRGSAQTTLCENCGWTAECPRCFVPLSLHADEYTLRCHICGYNEKVPASCPVCHNAAIIHKGIGTKLIQSELEKLYPKLRIERFDSDSSKQQGLENLYGDLYEGKIDIAIGTQVVAKGLDLPNLRTVGVVQADSGLVLPDYSAEERVFQLLTQVVGRVGRSEQSTNVIIQSYQPTHPAICFGLSQDYEGFYKHELERRKTGLFPPFCFLLKLVCSYKTESAAIRASKELARTLSRLDLPIQVLGPTPAFHERHADSYRWQLVIKSKKRQHLIDVLAHLPATHWQYELDPTSLL